MSQDIFTYLMSGQRARRIHRRKIPAWDRRLQLLTNTNGSPNTFRACNLCLSECLLLRFNTLIGGLNACLVNLFVYRFHQFDTCYLGTVLFVSAAHRQCPRATQVDNVLLKWSRHRSRRSATRSLCCIESNLTCRLFFSLTKASNDVVA